MELGYIFSRRPRLIHHIVISVNPNSFNKSQWKFERKIPVGPCRAILTLLCVGVPKCSSATVLGPTYIPVLHIYTFIIALRRTVSCVGVNKYFYQNLGKRSLSNLSFDFKMFCFYKLKILPQNNTFLGNRTFFCFKND